MVSSSSGNVRKGFLKKWGYISDSTMESGWDLWSVRVAARWHESKFYSAFSSWQLDWYARTSRPALYSPVSLISRGLHKLPVDGRREDSESFSSDPRFHLLSCGSTAFQCILLSSGFFIPVLVKLLLVEWWRIHSFHFAVVQWYDLGRPRWTTLVLS